MADNALTVKNKDPGSLGRNHQPDIIIINECGGVDESKVKTRRGPYQPTTSAKSHVPNSRIAGSRLPRTRAKICHLENTRQKTSISTTTASDL